MASDQGFLALPQDITNFAWSAPMRELANKVDLSDVGLKKLLISQGIVVPPQGHWNRVHAGQKIPAPPVCAPRRPGHTGRIQLDCRFRGLVPESGPIPEAGPFASATVPESLEELKALELRAIGKVTVARDLANAHPALGQLLKREEQLRSKQTASSYPWEHPLWDGPVAQRQLRLIDALFKTLSKRGASPWTRYSSGELELWCQIGVFQFQLNFGRDRNGRGGERAPSRDMPASTKLSIFLDQRFRSAVFTRWEDGALRLEQQIAEIAADLIVASEAAFREGLVEARERAEQWTHWQDEQREAELKRLREKRLADLKDSGNLLRQAGELRMLVEQVTQAVAGGSLDLTGSQLSKWRDWVLSEADRIDPVLSGQVMSHILVRQLDDSAD